nr:hypothetical protein [Actinomadura sp. CNU-125]
MTESNVFVGIGNQFRNYEPPSEVVTNAEFLELLDEKPPSARGRPVGRREDERRRLRRENRI